MTNIEIARHRTGLSVDQVAKKCRVCRPYWRSIELHGKAPLVLASRASRVLKCSMNILLFPAIKEPPLSAPSAAGSPELLGRLRTAPLLLKEGGAKSAAPRGKKQQPKLRLVPTPPVSVTLTASIFVWTDLFTDGDLSSELLDLIETKALSATSDTISISLPERHARVVMSQAKELVLDIRRAA